MPTVTLLPASLESNPSSHWDFHGGAADYTVLQNNNGDTSYALVDDVAAGGVLRLSLDNLPSLGAGTIDAVEIEFRQKDDPGSSAGSLKAILSNSAGDGPVLLTERASVATYKTYAETSATDCNGLAWTETLVNAASCGLKKIAGGANTKVRVTYLWWNVQYTLTGTIGASNLLAFMGNILLPLVGSGLLWREMTAIRSHLLQQRVRLSDAELKRVFWALTNHPRPVYSR